MALPPTSACSMHCVPIFKSCYAKQRTRKLHQQSQAILLIWGGKSRMHGIPVLVMAIGEPAPPELGDVIRCQCRAEGKKCSTVSCSCHKEHLTCTSYCNCHEEDERCSPYSQKTATTPAAEMDEAEEKEFTGVADVE